MKRILLVIMSITITATTVYAQSEPTTRNKSESLALLFDLKGLSDLGASNYHGGLGAIAFIADNLALRIGLGFANTVEKTRTSSDIAITVTGVVSGDAVSLGVPNAAVLTNTCYTAWVSGDNTVTVRFNDYDNADKDPASAVL